MKDARCHSRPVGGKPNRYVTAHFLMCAKCKQKIRKLTGVDKINIKKVISNPTT